MEERKILTDEELDNVVGGTWWQDGKKKRPNDDVALKSAINNDVIAPSSQNRWQPLIFAGCAINNDVIAPSSPSVNYSLKKKDIV